VPQSAKQAQEMHDRWPWAERSVWSERMLEALENGVKGSKWFSLIDKVWKTDNLSRKNAVEKPQMNTDAEGCLHLGVKIATHHLVINSRSNENRLPPAFIRVHRCPSVVSLILFCIVTAQRGVVAHHAQRRQSRNRRANHPAVHRPTGQPGCARKAVSYILAIAMKRDLV